jgi:hypothetical protein
MMENNGMPSNWEQGLKVSYVYDVRVPLEHQETKDGSEFLDLDLPR